MTPCSSCARHVRETETACPFCGAELAASPPRTVAIVGRVTRAAIFSAALVACGTKHEEPKPAPPAGSAEKLDQDFNQLLGSAEPGSAQPGSAVAHASDAAVAADAAQVAVPVDAMTDEERTRQLQHAQDQHKRDEEQALRRQREEDQRRREEQLRLQQQDFNQNAKPYGAPPARRRVV